MGAEERRREARRRLTAAPSFVAKTAPSYVERRPASHGPAGAETPAADRARHRPSGLSCGVGDRDRFAQSTRDHTTPRQDRP